MGCGMLVVLFGVVFVIGVYGMVAGVWVRICGLGSVVGSVV